MPVYLDCAATCPVYPEVATEITRHLLENYGNPSSRHHSYGTNAAAAVGRARAQIAAPVGARPEEVLFVSGATEANNLALLGLVDHGIRSNRKHIISTTIEHPSILQPLSELRERGFEIELAPVGEDGTVDAEMIVDRIRKDTLLLSVMHVNNETGSIQPICEIADHLLGSNEVIFHVDGTQSFAKIAGLDHPRFDMISCSAHKFCGPKGVGALIVRRRSGVPINLSARQLGGGQEMGLRSGTLAVPLIAGFGLAAEISNLHKAENFARAIDTKERLLDALKPLGPVVVPDSRDSSPYIVSLSFDGIDAEALIIATKDLVSVSNGSACSSGKLEPSHVLTAMNLPSKTIDSTVRMSWCPLTPEFDVQKLSDRISQLR